MMMISMSKIDLSHDFPGMASREIGDAAFAEVLRALENAEVVQLDFGGENPSPSFADQAIGSLAARLGLDEFKRRIRLVNAPDVAAPLLKHVILRRAHLASQLRK